MAMEHQDAIDTMFNLIYEMEEEKFFSCNYAEQLEECDFYNGDSCDKIPYKQLIEVTEDFGNSHYMMMRAVIESIKKFKEDFEKQVRAKEAYKKVNKKQSDKIKELKKEIEKVKKERYTDKQLEELIKEVDFEDIDCDCLPVENEFNIENWLHDIKEQIEEKNDIKLYELKEENKKLEKVIRSVGHQETIEACNKIWYDEEEEEEDDTDKLICYDCKKEPMLYTYIDEKLYCSKCCEIHEVEEENKDLKKEIKEHKKELLKACFDGYKYGCNYKQSVQDEIHFLNESGESQELIKEVFDESYQGGLNLVYNIETKDYEEQEEESDEEEKSEEEVNYNELNEEERKEINDIMWKCSIHNPENWKKK